MVDYLLTREHRRRKREIALRLFKQTGELRESLRELKELAIELREFYTQVGDESSAAHAEVLNISVFADIPIKVGSSSTEDLGRVLLLVLPEEKVK